MKNPLLPLPFVCLLSVASGSVAAWAQADATPPIPGVVGKLNAVTSNSIEIQTKSGMVLVEIKQPLRIYREAPSDLSHLKDVISLGVSVYLISDFATTLCFPKTTINNTRSVL
jgi:hypothetical protein